MTSTALTVKVFAVYVTLTGLVLAIAPNMMITRFGLPAAQEPWVHVLGVTAVVFGYIYWTCARTNTKELFAASVGGRLLFCAGIVVLVALSIIPQSFVTFGAVDALGAIWTALALRSELKAGGTTTQSV